MKFRNLSDAKAFVREHWQGSSRMMNVREFHTHYAEFTLNGFDLKDIGRVFFADEAIQFQFKGEVDNPG